MKLPLKFETASKYAYFVVVLGAFTSVIITGSWAYNQWGSVAMAMVLAAGALGAGILGPLGAEGLAAYWRRRHDAEMLKEVDRLKAKNLSPGGIIQHDRPYYMAIDPRKDIVDWEDRRRG